MMISNSISDELYSAIRNRIIKVDFFPGEKISENNLANFYQVSRTPIKNALIRLEGEGLVDVVSQKGTYVKKLSISNLKEVLTIRCYIEAMVVINEPLLKDKIINDKLKKNLEQQKELIASSQDLRSKVQKFYELDNEFHYLIFKLFSKENLWNYLINNFPQLQIYRVLSTLREKEHLAEKMEDHCNIYNCINGDEIKSEALKYYVEHIFEGDFNSLEIVKNNFPSYFAE